MFNKRLILCLPIFALALTGCNSSPDASQDRVTVEGHTFEGSEAIQARNGFADGVTKSIRNHKLSLTVYSDGDRKRNFTIYNYGSEAETNFVQAMITDPDFLGNIKSLGFSKIVMLGEDKHVLWEKPIS